MFRAASGNPNKILTVTVKIDAFPSPDIARVELAKAWNHAVKRIKREFHWKTLAYMVFVERTKLGWPHLHILLRCGFIPQKWLSDVFGELLASPNVWISKIYNPEHAVRYVAKYVTKEPAKFGSSKRYWLSRTYITRKELDPSFVSRFSDGVAVFKDRWSDFIQGRVLGRWLWKSFDDGWFVFLRPGHSPGDLDRYNPSGESWRAAGAARVWT